MASKYTTDQYVAAAKQYPLLSNTELGKRLGVSESTVRRNLTTAGYSRVYLSDGQFESYREVLPSPLRISGDWALTADWHVPLVNTTYVNSLISESRKRGINRLVIAGDFLNFDSLSKYDPKQNDAGLETEIHFAHTIMRTLMETFDDIVYLWGNHDIRMGRALGFKMSFSNTMRMVFGALGDEFLDKIQFSDLDHLWLDDIYVCHPSAYSRVPLSNPIKINAYTHSPVLCAHSHHSAVGFAPDGYNMVGELGGLFDAGRTRYLQGSSSFPRWVNGWAFYVKGHYEHRSPKFST